MEKSNICPCPNLECPNNGNCRDCTSRHLKIGTLNYCGFYSILPFLEEVSEILPISTASEKVKSLIVKQSLAYATLMDKHCITEEKQNELRIEKSNVSAH